jgi:hypothetical protein
MNINWIFFILGAVMLLVVTWYHFEYENDDFKVIKIVFINDIENKYVLKVAGNCIVKKNGDKIKWTCKVGPNNTTEGDFGITKYISYYIEQVVGPTNDIYDYKTMINKEIFLKNQD